jgi:DNA-binding CsgD family transcriptional regulator
VKKADRTRTEPDAITHSIPPYPILSAIVAVVPASSWMFARVKPSGDLHTLVDVHGNGDGTELADLSDEIRRQRAKASVGPRISATLRPFAQSASGVTLVFADARTTFGILILLRTAELGPFTSSEISMLTFALEAVTEFLVDLRQEALAHIADATERQEKPAVSPVPLGAFYVLNRELQIVLAWSSEEQRLAALTGLHARVAERLPPVLEETVRQLTAAWRVDSFNEPGVARPVSFLVMRTQPMSGPAGLFIGVRIDRFQPPNSLTDAAQRFHISPRELQVLARLFDGDHLEQIAAALSITSSTVQDHIKSMLDKTGSGNRSELIARVLGWESTPRAQRA